MADAAKDAATDALEESVAKLLDEMNVSTEGTTSTAWQHKGSNYTAPQNSLPTVDLEIQTKAWRIPRPGLCRATLKGRGVGFVLAMALDAADFQILNAMHLACANTKGRVTATMKEYVRLNAARIKQSLPLVAAMTSYGAAMEFARCCGGTLDGRELFILAPVVSLDNEYVVDLATMETCKGCEEGKIPVPLLTAHGAGAEKCCMASELAPGGCPSCGTSPHNSYVTGGVKNCRVGSCQQNFKRMIWCKKCHIACWCSKQCQLRSRAAHERECVGVQLALQSLGVGRVCFCCGLAEPLNGPKLKQCNGCQAAFYCSARAASALIL